MSSDDTNVERVMQALAGLPTYDPDPRRAARLRARCHAALDGRRPAFADALAQPARSSPWRMLESAAVVGASLAYLADVVLRAVLLHRV